MRRSAVTLGELLNALAARGSTLTADGESLRHRGPRFMAADAVRRALATLYDEMIGEPWAGVVRLGVWVAYWVAFQIAEVLP
jgi:hypothetical protein